MKELESLGHSGSIAVARSIELSNLHGRMQGLIARKEAAMQR